jgi:RNase P subunit RPR2
MICEQCHALMIEQPARQRNERTDNEQVMVLRCPECGHTEYQPLITSFWRRLAA